MPSWSASSTRSSRSASGPTATPSASICGTTRSGKITIVGVVGTVKQYGLDIDGRIVRVPAGPNPGWHVARTSGDPSAVARDMVRKIRELDSTITISDVQTMTIG
jgi:hypothetical protein